MNTPAPQQPTGEDPGQPQPDDTLHRPGMILAIVLGALLVTAVGFFVVYKLFFAPKWHVVDPADLPDDRVFTPSPVVNVAPDYGKKKEVKEPEVKDVVMEGEDEFGEFVRSSEHSLKDYTKNFLVDNISISWLDKAKKLPESEITNIMQTISEQFVDDKAAMQDPESYLDDLGNIFIYELGKLEGEPQLEGKTVYLLGYPVEGMAVSIADVLVVFDEHTEKFVRLSEAERTNSLRSILFPIENYVDGQIVIPELRPVSPKDIAIPNAHAVLQYRSAYSPHSGFLTNPASTNHIGGISNIITGEVEGPISPAQAAFTDDQTGLTVYDVDTEYRVRLEDASHHVYSLIPTFLRAPSEAEKKEMYPIGLVADVTWHDDFVVGDNKYVLGGTVSHGGCASGIDSAKNIVNDQEWFDESNVKEVGTTVDSDPIYVLTDAEGLSIYEDFFKMGGDAGYMHAHEDIDYKNLKDVTEEDRRAFFYSQDPIIFWQDHKGNWRSYFKSTFRSLAECGKPVIYLYPEETTDVRVEVAPNGGFTYTDPEYPRDGWVVRAEPNGRLYSYVEQASYPYLFWEGHADGFGFSDRGFVFSMETLERDMQDLLARAGLNKQETADFLEFWLPLMKEKPYVFVTFASQRAFERAAPLTISPRPDSVLRVFMYFEPLDEYKDVKPLSLRGFERRGFSVVEWGGVLEKK